MTKGSSQGTFDMLNDALFVQMERLANAEGDAIEREIERSKAVGQLAGNIIGNANTAINLMKFQASEGMDLAGAVAVRPRMLETRRKPQEKQPVDWDIADDWLLENASEHTLSYLASRLGRSLDEVESRCQDLGVEPKRLDGSRAEYEDFKRDLTDRTCTRLADGERE